ncbi:HNH endonuclease [Streptomyces sp. C10-9-1]|uniref:HNH endonuclease n=1 Tax=Streptomyces sp. C10-9-1 TaxID=1859285 RepID=UPI0021134D13|nr:HNH endonuclease signature motif containing protein [Streptomyces sp. C10-9-1]MCQ6552470.1 HNH endonuclease [Streptomyces sp. C10-9-1]
MTALPRPVRNPITDLDTAIARRRQRDIRQLLQDARADVVSAYEQYEDILRDIANFDSVAANQTELAQALLGNVPLMDSKRPLGSLRTAVLDAAEHGQFRCPLCERAQVCALDHFLPKEQYPEFSIFVDNLIPVCERCNRLKGAECDRQNGLLLFHAYFDDLPSEKILVATVQTDNVVTITFELQRPPDLSEAAFARIEKHFTVLQLLEFYRKEAIAEVTDNADSYVQAAQRSGAAGIQQMIGDQLAGTAWRGTNHWKNVLYRGLLDSANFCEGGYLRLLPSSLRNRAAEIATGRRTAHSGRS